MSRTGRLTREQSDTLLLVLAALTVLAPHLARLPLWAGAVIVLTLGWRSGLTLLGRSLPPLWLLLPVALLAMAAVYRDYHTLLGRDAGVAMLALLLAFKLLEMQARRDLFVVIFLSLFLLLSGFFYSQTMLAALAMLPALLLLLTAQLSFQYSGAVPPLRRRLATAATILGWAAPAALLLFIAFPRIDGPLWGLPGDAGGARSGLSETMAPGSVAALALSEEVALRARFDGAAPAQEQLYWRGIVLGDYDGRTWRRLAPARAQPADEPRAPVRIGARGPVLAYQVTLEANRGRWLFALELGDVGTPSRPIATERSAELEYALPAGPASRLRYGARAWLDGQLDAGAAPEQQQAWLRLPAGYNGRSLALAAQLRRATPAQTVQAALQHLREGGYSYTLKPPLLGRHAVDEFLFDSRAGFCEHYAGAFVVLMRAAGIPARVVTGYQGGERNPLDGYLTVRQSDAHAWAEVWLAGQGWRRVDPTAAVAPERVSSSLARALAPAPPFGLEALIGLPDQRPAWLNQLGFAWSALNNAWAQWVLDYNPQRQRDFLQALADTLLHVAPLAALALCAILSLLLWRLRRRRRGDPLAAVYHAFCRQQARHGYARRADEGPQQYGARLQGMAASAAKREAMARFLQLYAGLRYGRSSPDQVAASLKTLRQLLTLCR